MENLIVGIIILAIIGFAIAKIVKAKRSGVKCIGCPHGQTSGSDCGCHSGK